MFDSTPVDQPSVKAQGSGDASDASNDADGDDTIAARQWRA